MTATNLVCKSQLRISIDGNGACGKSTVLKTISEKTDLPVFAEPVEEWKEWLQIYYKDARRWAFTLNMQVLVSFKELSRRSVAPVAIFERSPLDCKEIFMKLFHDQGTVTEAEYTLFTKVYREISWEPDCIVYIRTSPDTCYERMVSRHRECEEAVEYAYIEQLHSYYERAMAQLQRDKKVYIVDGEASEEEVYVNVLRIINTELSSCGITKTSSN